MFAFTSLSSVFRLLMLGLLLAGVLVKPVIAVAGELHEAEHVLLTSDAGPADDGSSGPDDPSDTENRWHALMHYGYCSALSMVLLPPVTLGSPTPAAVDPPPLLSAEFQPPAHSVAFRPPITA